MNTLVTEKPLVSVIIPFLNAEKFFEETIESVFAQTYTKWELILVDDGSNDNSTKIAMEYRDRYTNKVIYLEHDQHQNKGSSASRNLGIQNAEGKYIAMLDADDVWVENKLEQQVEILEAYPDAGMVYGKSKHWYSWTKNKSDFSRDYIVNINSSLDYLYKPPKLLTRKLESIISSPSISNVMFRSDAVRNVGGFEEKLPETYDSQTLLTKMYINFDTFIANCCWVSKREYQPEIQISKPKANQRVETELDYLRWLASYISAKEINDQYLNKLLRDRIWGHENPTLNKLHEYNVRNIGAIKKTLKPIVNRLIPISIRHYLLAKLRGQLYKPPLGWVHFGELRRLKPISSEWGEDRGLPIDRYYIESFLAQNMSDILGNVVEVGGGIYTNKFGSTSITKKDILCLEKGEVPNTTVVADLTNAPHIPSDSFNCIIIVQTLQLIYDVRSVIDTLYRILKPGGLVLATVSGISQTTDDEPWDRNWCWGFTSLSARKLFEERFPAENLEVTGYGNVLVAASFLYGLAKEDLTEEELNFYDSRYEITISVRAVKPG